MLNRSQRVYMPHFRYLRAIGQRCMCLGSLGWSSTVKTEGLCTLKIFVVLESDCQCSGPGFLNPITNRLTFYKI